MLALQLQKGITQTQGGGPLACCENRSRQPPQNSQGGTPTWLAKGMLQQHKKKK